MDRLMSRRVFILRFMGGNPSDVLRNAWIKILFVGGNTLQFQICVGGNPVVVYTARKQWLERPQRYQ